MTDAAQQMTFALPQKAPSALAFSKPENAHSSRSRSQHRRYPKHQVGFLVDSTMLLHHAISLNNHAASNPSRESMGLFRMALRTLRHHCLVSGRVLEIDDAAPRHVLDTYATQESSPGVTLASSGATNCNKPGCRGEVMKDDIVSPPSQLLPKVNRLSVSSTGPGTSLMGHGRHNENYLRLFDRALVISAEGHVTKNLVAAVLLFNLAMHHHTLGTFFGRSVMLARAKKVYQMSLAALQSFANQDGDVPDLLLLAIFNNLAELEASFHFYGTMRSYLDCVQAILCDEDLDLKDDDLQLFFVNILLPEPLGAAAA